MGERANSHRHHTTKPRSHFVLRPPILCHYTAITVSPWYLIFHISPWSPPSLISFCHFPLPLFHFLLCIIYILFHPRPQWQASLPSAPPKFVLAALFFESDIRRAFRFLHCAASRCRHFACYCLRHNTPGNPPSVFSPPTTSPPSSHIFSTIKTSQSQLRSF